MADFEIVDREELEENAKARARLPGKTRKVVCEDGTVLLTRPAARAVVLPRLRIEEAMFLRDTAWRPVPHSVAVKPKVRAALAAGPLLHQLRRLDTPAMRASPRLTPRPSLPPDLLQTVQSKKSSSKLHQTTTAAGGGVAASLNGGDSTVITSAASTHGSSGARPEAWGHHLVNAPGAAEAAQRAQHGPLFSFSCAH